jgi:hypothetical protein
MNNFKTCPNGHNYSAEQFAICPYCPANSDDTDYRKTLSDFKNTQANNEVNQFGKTMINEGGDDFINTMNNAIKPGKDQFKQTHIIMDGKTDTPSRVQQTEKRKLVGWLVTFNNDQYGVDFKLFSGKNKIGRASVCDIVISDPSVSDEHATILFRNNEFLIKDDFSTNGTVINGAPISEGKLEEGDELTLGNTLFKFKTVF